MYPKRDKVGEMLLCLTVLTEHVNRLNMDAMHQCNECAAMRKEHMAILERQKFLLSEFEHKLLDCNEYQRKSAALDKEDAKLSSGGSIMSSMNKSKSPSPD